MCGARILYEQDTVEFVQNIKDHIRGYQSDEDLTSSHTRFLPIPYLFSIFFLLDLSLVLVYLCQI